MSLPEVLAFFDRCVEVTTANIDAVADLTHWQARWCLAHISTEVARHTGHADIIRETIDGKTSFELNDLAEQADR